MQLPDTIHPIGEPFVELLSIDSTNNYAMALARDGKARHGSAFFAYSQTAGRGRLGKHWESGAGLNIQLTIVIEPAFLSVLQQFQLSVVAALACRNFFNNYALDNVQVKWPNDIYWNGRKAGGILVENAIAGNQWLYAIIGMGININQVAFGEELTRAVSLKQITGKNYDVIMLAKELCSYLESEYNSLKNGSFSSLLTSYNEVLYKLGEPVRLRKGNIVFETVIQGVNAAGQLITRDTIERQFEVGEIEWLL